MKFSLSLLIAGATAFHLKEFSQLEAGYADKSATCAEAKELKQKWETAYFSCTPPAVIEEITFASYGLPGGDCGKYHINKNCHATTSMAVVEDTCLGLSECAITPNDDFFGENPCRAEGKKLKVQYVCTHIGEPE